MNAEEQRKAIITEAEKSYQPRPTTIKGPTGAELPIVQIIQHSMQQVLSTQPGLDPKEVLIEIGGSASYLRDQNGDLDWPDVDDVDVFLYVPDQWKGLLFYTGENLHVKLPLYYALEKNIGKDVRDIFPQKENKSQPV